VQLELHPLFSKQAHKWFPNTNFWLVQYWTSEACRNRKAQIFVWWIYLRCRKNELKADAG